MTRQEFNKYDQRVTRILWFSFGFVAGALVVLYFI